MLTLSAKIRQTFGKKVKNLRENGLIPAILYGPGIKESLALEVDYKAFEKIYKEAGESSLISLVLQNFSKENLGGLEVLVEEDKSSSSPFAVAREDEKPAPHRNEVSGAGSVNRQQKKFLVLIHNINYEPLTGHPIHVDFYQPRLEEEIEAKVPIILEGEAPAVKELGGTLVKNISEVEVKALPQKLPKEIKIDVSSLKTFEDHILIKDLKAPEGVKILKDPEEIIASVAPPEKVEEELEKPIEEKVEEVEKVEEKKEKEEKEVEEKSK